MHQQPVFANSKNYLNGVSDYLFTNGLCLPSGSNLTDEEFERIFSCFSYIFSKKFASTGVKLPDMIKRTHDIKGFLNFSGIDKENIISKFNTSCKKRNPKIWLCLR
jgi:hypothetical protein